MENDLIFTSLIITMILFMGFAFFLIIVHEEHPKEYNPRIMYLTRYLLIAIAMLGVLLIIETVLILYA